jgi:DNA-binding NarL/FixJ family response regulator
VNSAAHDPAHDVAPVGAPARRVLLVEDEDFTRTAVASVLETAGFCVHAVSSAAQAIAEVADFDPHCVVSDLDLGPGPSGIDLLQRLAADSPWVGLVVLTAHRSIELAVGGSSRLPEGTVMVVKSQLDSMDDISRAVDQSLSNIERSPVNAEDEHGAVTVTPMQADVLRMMAEGLSNSGIASRRGTSIRAAEAAVQRTLQALGIEARPEFSSRVLAVRMWQSGQVTVR